MTTRVPVLYIDSPMEVLERGADAAGAFADNAGKVASAYARHVTSLASSSAAWMVDRVDQVWRLGKIKSLPDSDHDGASEMLEDSPALWFALAPIVTSLLALTLLALVTCRLLRKRRLRSECEAKTTAKNRSAAEEHALPSKFKAAPADWRDSKDWVAARFVNLCLEKMYRSDSIRKRLLSSWVEGLNRELRDLAMKDVRSRSQLQASISRLIID